MTNELSDLTSLNADLFLESCGEISDAIALRSINLSRSWYGGIPEVDWLSFCHSKEVSTSNFNSKSEVRKDPDGS